MQLHNVLTAQHICVRCSQKKKSIYAYVVTDRQLSLLGTIMYQFKTFLHNASQMFQDYQNGCIQSRWIILFHYHKTQDSTNQQIIYLAVNKVCTCSKLAVMWYLWSHGHGHTVIPSQCSSSLERKGGKSFKNHGFRSQRGMSTARFNLLRPVTGRLLYFIYRPSTTRQTFVHPLSPPAFTTKLNASFCIFFSFLSFAVRSIYI